MQRLPLFLVALAISSAALHAQAPANRTWTSTDGKKIEASFLAIEGDGVKVRMANGSTVTVPLARLSAEDQAYAKNQGTVVPPTAVPAQLQVPPGSLKGSLDELIDWNNPWSLTPDKFRAVAEAIPHKQSVRSHASTLTGPRLVLRMGGPERTGGKLLLFGGRLEAGAASAIFEGDKLIGLEFLMGRSGWSSRGVTQSELNFLKAELGKRTGDTAPQQETGRPKPLGLATLWSHPSYKVEAQESTQSSSAGKQADTVLITMWPPNNPPR